MHFKTLEECRTYVEVELDRVVRSRPPWQATPSPQSPDRPADALSWTISPAPEKRWPASWYELEARFGAAEFLLWFGNHQVGHQQLSWIVHPAIHVAFKDLWPRPDVLAIRFSLGDVLEEVIGSLELQHQYLMRFEMNTFSMT